MQNKSMLNKLLFSYPKRRTAYAVAARGMAKKKAYGNRRRNKLTLNAL